MRLARDRKQPPRAIAEELVEQANGARRRRAGRDRRARVRQPLARAGLVRRRARGDPRRRPDVRRRLRAGEAARAGRDRLRQPDRADHRRRARATAPTATPSPACSRSRATRSSASTTTTTRARRWSASAPRSTPGRRGEEPPEDGYQGAYIAELAKLPDDPVPAMLERIEATMERFRIHFDSWAKQSELEQRLPEFLPRLDTYEKDGAVWARSSAYGDEDDRVLIRSEGGAPTYRAADVVYLADKLDRGLDRAIYVLGADHHGTRNWYAAVARMLGYDPDRVEVLLYQLVHLTRGGEAAKMSKRRGDVVFLDEFLDEVGVDAARWYLVSRGPDQAIEIDVDLAAEQEPEEPGLLRPVRARPDRRHPAERRRGGVPSAEPPAELAAEERDLIKRLAEFPASSPRRPSGAARTRSRPTRSASPTTSTASTTTTRCSARRRRRSASASSPRRGR